MSSYLFHHFARVRTQGEYFTDIGIKAESLQDPGFYALLRNEGQELWPVEMQYVPGDASLPLAVMLAGYRGDAVNGAGSVTMRKILSEAGFPVLAVNYSGFDHYAQDEVAATHDPATMDTHIRDLNAVMDLIGDRPVMLQPTSASITVAMQCLRPNVSDILAMTPFPNMEQERVACLLEQAEAGDYPERMTFGERKRAAFVQKLRDEHVAIYQVGRADPLKFTLEHISSTAKYCAYEFECAADVRPFVHVVYSEQDIVVRPGTKERRALGEQSLSDRWVKRLCTRGFIVDATSVPGFAHDVNVPLVDAFRVQAQSISTRHRAQVPDLGAYRMDGGV
jgi:hypothetical protein